ncbi:MAG: hydrogenase expression/formation protein [Phyllobacteriaceae bacterium]|nr:hydrogenase expression/formation protein [Phyllobacteriaceae bacterium]
MNSLERPPEAETVRPLASAVLAEVARALSLLAETGEETTIDLRSLPLGPADLEALVERLGDGEVACTLEVAGRSEVRETGYAGVWWIRHFGADDAVAVEEIAVTRIPEILVSHPDDVAHAAKRLADVAAEPVPRADEED